MLLGTLVNTATVILGSLFGVLLAKFFNKSKRLRKLPDALMKAISVFVVFIGIKGAFETDKFLVVLISLVLGTLIGSLLKIDEGIKKFGDFVERKLTKKKKEAPVQTEDGEEVSQKSFSRAFVSTSLTCCVGAMSITGALKAGMEGDHSILFAKSVLDFITAFVYSTAFGIGSILSSVVVFLYQGLIELGAGALAGILESSVNEISAVGSLVVMALGFNMLGATKIKIANMLPAIFLPVFLCLLPCF